MTGPRPCQLSVGVVRGRSQTRGRAGVGGGAGGRASTDSIGTEGIMWKAECVMHMKLLKVLGERPEGEGV